jgi:hypothetical protein
MSFVIIDLQLTGNIIITFNHDLLTFNADSFQKQSEKSYGRDRQASRAFRVQRRPRHPEQDRRLQV